MRERPSNSALWFRNGLICLDDFPSASFAMLAGLPSERVHLELADCRLQKPYYGALLFARCARPRDQLHFVLPFVMPPSYLLCKVIDTIHFFWTWLHKRHTVWPWPRLGETVVTVGLVWGRPFGRPRNIFMRALRRRESTIPTR